MGTVLTKMELLSLLVFLSTAAAGILASPAVSFSCKENFFNWPLYANLTLGCWSESKILFYGNYTCYPLHSSRPCKDVGRLVFLNSSCAETTCRPYKDSSGSRCSYPDVSHEGECKDPGDATACGSILGRRLVPDLFGDYTCQCDRNTGFVEYGGSCQVEYLQGPCEKREQLMMMEKEVECVKNTCYGGNVTWSNGECYPFEFLSNVLPPFKLTQEEYAFVGKNYNLGRVPVFPPENSGSFRNCAYTDSNGYCLVKAKLPEVKKHEDEDFLFLRLKLCAHIDSNGYCLEKKKLPEVKKQEDEDFLFLRLQLFPGISNDSIDKKTRDYE